MLKTAMNAVKPQSRWGAHDQLMKIIEGTDDAQDELYIDYAFEHLDDVNIQTTKTIALLTKWSEKPNGQSTPSLIRQSLAQFGIEAQGDESLTQAIFMASYLAEIPNDLPYHNAAHFRKVVLHTIRMIAAHNFIFKQGNHVLGKEAVAKLLIAACIHDLNHDGQGNIINRKYQFARTEQQSFECAKPYLEACGLSEEMLGDIRVMLICTDASPFGDPISPSRQVRRAYEYHFGENEDAEDLDLGEELSILAERDDLTLLCMMLHEADIMNSAGVSYDITCQESLAVSQEIGTEACPEDTLLFLEKVCLNEMQSDAARYLGQKNIDDIRKQLIAAYHDGNKGFS